jgi:hypothetical protein
VLRSDRGSEFINASVLDVCGCHGCVSTRILLPRAAREIPKWCCREDDQRNWTHGTDYDVTVEDPDLANTYCLLQSVDILNMLPSTANPPDPLSNVTGFSPYLLYYNSAPPLEQIYAFGSFCTVHLDDDHIDSSRPIVRAASCIYLCRTHHYHSQGHIVWEYHANGKGRTGCS